MKLSRVAAVLCFLLGAAGNMAFASVCYIGSVGTAGEKAAVQFFGVEENAVPVANLTEALSLLKSGKCNYAVLPLESGASGLVYDNIDAVLADSSLVVSGEVKLSENPANMTRFWVISSTDKALKEGDKAIAVVRGPINSIIKMSYELVQMGFKVQAIHERPIKGKLGEYQYVMEVDGLNPKYTLTRLISRTDFGLQGELLGSFEVK